MSRVALLVFNRNQTDGVVRAVRLLRGHVAEIVVVDSSSPRPYQALLESLHGSGARVVRAPALGCTEPFRPFAHSELQSPWVLSVDADEAPTPGLVRRIEHLGDEPAAYRIAREETSLRATTRHTRLYRPARIRYEGWIHEDPYVDGVVDELPHADRLIHEADYPGYLAPGGRGTSYLLTECFERPFTASSLRREFPESRSAQLLGRSDEALPRSAAGAFLYAWAIEKRMSRPSGRGERLQHRLFTQYLWARLHAFYSLPPGERREAVHISTELRAAGGPIPYLGFDDFARVRRLASWTTDDMPPAERLRALLIFRHRTGSPMDEPPMTVVSPRERARGALSARSASGADKSPSVTPVSSR